MFLELLVVAAHEVGSDVSLEQSNDPGETLVTHVLKLTEDTGFEEDLGVTETVFIGIKSQSPKNLLSGDLAINESSWNSVGSKDGVSGRQ